MKRIIKKLFIPLITIMSIASCSSDHDIELPPKDPNLHLSIRDVKSLYKGEDMEYGQDIDSIFGTVVSNASAGNIPEGIIVMQQDEEGIAISFDEGSKIDSFSPGDSIAVDIRGGALVKRGGNLLIIGPTVPDVEILESGKEVKSIPVTLSDLKKDFDKYYGTLVKVSGADIIPKPEDGETYKGIKNLSDGSTAAGDIKLYSKPDSDMADETALTNATFTGIALYGKSEKSDTLLKEIWPRNIADVDNTSLPKYSDIVLTGFLADPRGYDQKVPGEETKYGGGEEKGGVTIVHKGGYEYMQFMALADIDFAKTPYSVVVARDGVLKKNGGPVATEKGWAEGGHTTYKFNLTSGKAEAGTFFYVGSSSKELGGYYPDGYTEDISGANWIRSISVYTGNTDDITGDDGMGNSTSGLLANTGQAVGIAVFEGTNVTPGKKPIDAVFYNKPSKGFPFADDTYSYLVPEKSDLYSAQDEDGNDQPYLGEGSNTFIIDEDIAGDSSRWLKMGGIFSEDNIISPRNHPSVIKIDVNSTISDIESGSGVTVFRNK